MVKIRHDLALVYRLVSCFVDAFLILGGLRTVVVDERALHNFCFSLLSVPSSSSRKNQGFSYAIHHLLLANTQQDEP